MRRLHRPSPAFIVAGVALVVAVGGTAFAGPVAHVISGKQIKRHSIAGNRMKPNTVTGAQVKESSLKTVPKAATAGHATVADVAGNAAAVAGLRIHKVSYLAPNEAASGKGPSTTILVAGGLTLTATCDVSGIVDVEATTAVDNTDYQSQIESQNGTHHDGWSIPDFDSGAANAFDITDAQDAGHTAFVYTTPAGEIVSGDLAFDDANSEGDAIFNNTAACIVDGFVTSTS